LLLSPEEKITMEIVKSEVILVRDGDVTLCVKETRFGYSGKAYAEPVHDQRGCREYQCAYESVAAAQAAYPNARVKRIPYAQTEVK
jgi:hypothetical protein